MTDRGRQIGLCGTFDVENYGDLLFPLIAEAELSRRFGSIKLRRFSYSPKAPPDWPYAVCPLSKLPTMAANLDGMMIGGGDIVRFDKDVAPGYGSPTPTIHHPTGYWLTPALIALHHGCPLVWNAPGVFGDIPAWAESLMQLAIKLSRYVAVRDEPSRDALARFAGNTEITVVPDTCFSVARLLDAKRPSAAFTRLRKALALTRPYLVVQATGGLQAFSKLVRSHPQYFQDYRLVSLPVGPILGDNDAILSGDYPNIVRLPNWPHPLLIAELIRGSAGVVGTSMHLAITALAFGVPVFKPYSAFHGKYAILSGFDSVCPFAAEAEIDPRWFAERMGRVGVEPAVRKAIAHLDRHWDKIASIFAAGEENSATREALGQFWQSLPASLEAEALRHVTTRTAFTKEREAAIAERDQQIIVLNSLLANSRAEAAALNEEIIAIHHTTSWRLTAPVRWIGRRRPWRRRVHKLKYVAFYLPQFYPIPENDAWWGKNFTEWTNTSKARPLFPDHYQPHVPADLGYYDLRVRDVQRKQIAIAKQYGIDAFCFYYYWFNGRRLLDRPLDEFLLDDKADIEFCLCWTNVNWTRKWDASDASENEILIAQDYSPTSDIKFIESLIPYFQDRRYLRVGGAPVLVVYGPQYMPNARQTASRWRDYCRALGIGEIHLVAALTYGNKDFEQFGYDAGVEFPPHNLEVGNLADKILSEAPLRYVVAYGDVASQFIECDYAKRRVYRTVFPSWDNTARVQERGLVVLDGTPKNYERWLYASSGKTVDERLPNDRLLFINAWNEWAEGCHLEPDQRYGRGFLEATLRVKSEKSFINSAKLEGSQNVELLREATELKKQPKPLRRAEAFRLFLRGKLLRASQREHEAILRKVRDSGLFDAKYYLEQNEDVRASGVDPLSHFIEYGVYELRNPCRFFDVKWYLLSNPDVRAARVNPLLHYIERGRKEGRRPHPKR